MSREAGVKPTCDTCPVSDIAPDIELNEFIESYMKAMSVESRGNYVLATEILRGLGLLDDFDFLSKLDSIWSSYIKAEREKVRLMERAKRY